VAAAPRNGSEPLRRARSQLAGLVTAGVSLATLLLLAPLLGLMPQATLAAVVIVYSIGLIEPAEFRAILRYAGWNSCGPRRPSQAWWCSAP